MKWQVFHAQTKIQISRCLVEAKSIVKMKTLELKEIQLVDLSPTSHPTPPHRELSIV
jgi:hypothetical protein